MKLNTCWSLEHNVCFHIVSSQFQRRFALSGLTMSNHLPKRHKLVQSHFSVRFVLSQISALRPPLKCEINQLILDQSVSEKRGHACPPETIGLLFTNGHSVVFVTVSFRIPLMEFANYNSEFLLTFQFKIKRM